MAQLKWQKPADGSDTLAIAQIRWHRTFTPSSAHRCRRSCAVFSHHGSCRRRPLHSSNDHGQPCGRVIPVGKEAAVWPWSSPSPRDTTSATSGKPKTAQPSVLSAGTTSTPPRPENHPAAGGDPEPRPGQTVERQPYEIVVGPPVDKPLDPLDGPLDPPPCANRTLRGLHLSGADEQAPRDAVVVAADRTKTLWSLRLNGDLSGESRHKLKKFCRTFCSVDQCSVSDHCAGIRIRRSWSTGVHSGVLGLRAVA